MEPNAAPGIAPALLGPRGHGLLGNLREFNRDQLGFYTRCAREYGDVVPVRLGPSRGLLVYHPDAIEEVLVTRNRDFIKSRGVRLLRGLLGDGLFVAEGDLWLRQRRLMQPAFHRQRVAAYGAVMAAYASRRAAEWDDGAVLDIHEEMMAVTRAIVAKTLFDADVSDEARAIGDASEIVMEYFGKRLGSLLALVPLWLPTPANRRLHGAIRGLDEVVYRMIAERRRSPEDRGDLLSILLQAQDAGDGSRMTDRQVRDEVMTLFLAGHETTANALSWTWYLLSQNPECEARLHREIDEVVGDRRPAFEDLPRLTYAERVLAETIRLYPPAWAIGRTAKEPFTLGGYEIPTGSTCILASYVTQRDERFFPDPERFDPDRWLPEARASRPRFSYFPFGGGARTCIGERFALMEGVLVLATLAQAWRLRLAAGQKVEPVPLINTLRAKGGLRLVVEPRS
jgi:cytochrome P450